MSRTVRVILTFLIGCAMFIVLPAAAWGLGDIAGFINNTARLSYLMLTLGLNAFAAVRIPEVGKPAGNPKQTVARQHAAIFLLQIFSMAVLIVASFSDRWGLGVMPDCNAVRYAGLAMFVAGFLGMHLAEANLGKQFSIEVSIQEEHALVTDGLYKYIRHPRYAFMMLFAAGVPLLFRSWCAFIPAGALTLVLLWRIYDEEKLLRKEFGLAWEGYAKRTRRLIPYLF